MKLGKPHLIGSLALLVGSIAYNVWVFSQPQKPTTAPRGPAPVNALPETAAGRSAAAAVDLSHLPALPEVALDRLPEWPRDPFTSVRPPKPPADVTPAVQAQAAPPEPDLVVASILYSPERRLAIVNGHIVRIGDAIGSAKVVDIQPRAIVVDSPSRGRQTIELKMPDSRSEIAARKGAAAPKGAHR